MRHLMIGTLRYVALAIAAMLPAAAGYGQSCVPEACAAGPCLGQEILNDPAFVNNCPDWVLSGNSTRVYGGPGNGYYISMVAGSGLDQDVTPPSGTFFSHDIGVSVNIVIGQNTGTERLTIKVIRQSDGAVLETAGSIFPSDTSGLHYFSIGDYTGQAVRIEATVNVSPHTGDTEFQMQGLRWWES